ncbi:MAG: hypothetical protein ACOYL8_04145 [Patescibacteria group bacterium]
MLQAVINESLGRKCNCTHSIYQSLEDQKVDLYDPKQFICIENVPEFVEDEEARLIEQIDEENALQFARGEEISFVGVKPHLSLPGRVVKIAKRIINPESTKKIKAAHYQATTGLMVLVY